MSSMARESKHLEPCNAYIEPPKPLGFGTQYPTGVRKLGRCEGFGDLACACLSVCVRPRAADNRVHSEPNVIIITTNYAVVASHLYMAVAVNAELLAWVSWGVCGTHAMYVSHDPVPSGTYIGCTKDRELMALLLWLVQYPSPQLRYTSLHAVCWLNMYIKY